eukprot:jgi/Tetstr1/458187/TSEL_044678.t1
MRRVIWSKAVVPEAASQRSGAGCLVVYVELEYARAGASGLEEQRDRSPTPLRYTLSLTDFGLHTYAASFPFEALQESINDYAEPDASTLEGWDVGQAGSGQLLRGATGASDIAALKAEIELADGGVCLPIRLPPGDAMLRRLHGAEEARARARLGVSVYREYAEQLVENEKLSIESGRCLAELQSHNHALRDEVAQLRERLGADYGAAPQPSAHDLAGKRH